MKYGASGNIGGIVARVIKTKVGKDPAKQYDKTVVLINVGTDKNGKPVAVAVTGFGRDAALLEGVEAGMEVVCEIRPDTREYQGQYYDSHAVVDCNIMDETGAAPLASAGPVGKALVDTADDAGMPF
jgi:hypothetical protein